MILSSFLMFFSFFFNDTATTEIYTLSLHDALPISLERRLVATDHQRGAALRQRDRAAGPRRVEQDRKSTRLNSSHVEISYAVFCLKKKKKINTKKSKKKKKQKNKK